MIYALTEQQHAQIVDAMSVSYPTDRSKLSAHIEALAMLKGLKPLEPRQWGAREGLLSCSKYRHDPHFVTPLYALEAK